MSPRRRRAMSSPTASTRSTAAGGTAPARDRDRARQVVQVHDLLDDPRHQEVAHGHGRAAVGGQRGVVVEGGQPVGEAAEPRVELGHQRGLARRPERGPALADRPVRFVAEPAEQRGVVVAGVLERQRFAGRRQVEVLGHDPAAGAGEVAGQPADRLVLEDRRAVPGGADRLARHGGATASVPARNTLGGLRERRADRRGAVGGRCGRCGHRFSTSTGSISSASGRSNPNTWA